MQNAQVIPFRFEAREVRTMLIDDQPWFVAADVCQALAIRNSRDAFARLDEDEKGVANADTLGGTQNVSILNESGLYSLILTSRKAEAKRFKKWVTAEVLPAIRKHGRYEDEQGKMATLIGETIGTDGFHMLGALIKGKVASLPAAVQRKAKSKIWSQTHAAFGVRSAADIPASQLDSARNFIAAYALEGEWLPKDARPKILSREHRVLGYLDLNGVERWEDIAAGAYILTRREFIDSMLVHCDMPVTTDEMFEFAQLALANLNSRSNCMAAQLKALRKRD
ncbi:phage antirepressor protein [Pseudomonas fulva]|uniref:BRO family protein n=1 Tax=Pseudomonas fulva TaxID=47880 RepID=UPI00201DF7B3|nr:BRO family protein [Pseudomonas fulva]UQY33597.1 phage antirepressor protein [Pseudomonas fulva]